MPYPHYWQCLKCCVHSAHKQPQNISAESVQSTCGQTWFLYFQLLNQRSITCGMKNTEMKCCTFECLYITFCCNLWMCKQLGKTIFVTVRNRACDCCVIRWAAANTAKVRGAFEMLGTTHSVTQCHLNPQQHCFKGCKLKKEDNKIFNNALSFK